MEIEGIVTDLRAIADPTKVKGRARFGIPEENSLGVTMPQLRKYARELSRDQALADQLWHSPIHELKILATIVADPEDFPLRKADAWMKYLYSWDLTDQYCLNLLIHTDYCLELPFRWAGEEGEFQRRAAFSLIAIIAVHRKELTDEDLLAYLPVIRSATDDNRNFVKKAVNWAIRQIGKRNYELCQAMISFCEELLALDEKAAKWIARDALRELKTKN